MHRSISFSMCCDKISCRRVCRAMPAPIFAITPTGAHYRISRMAGRWCNLFTFRRSTRRRDAEGSSAARCRFPDLSRPARNLLIALLSSKPTCHGRSLPKRVGYPDLPNLKPVPIAQARLHETLERRAFARREWQKPGDQRRRDRLRRAAGTVIAFDSNA